MSYETLLVEHQDAVTKITLNRPQSLNALSEQLLIELRAALEEAARSETCRCVLLTGAGRGFSSGADLVDAAKSLKPGERPDLGAPLETTYHPVLRAIRATPKPVIAALNGTAAGAGLNIALACDIVIAARSAKLIQAFIKIGLVPDAGGTWSIPRLIGRARATRWMMTGDSLMADKALEWGLLTDVFDDEQLPAEAEALAQRLSKMPTKALGEIKRLMDASMDNGLDAQCAMEAGIQTQVGFSDDAMEGIMSFIQKRAPNFKGR